MYDRIQAVFFRQSVADKHQSRKFHSAVAEPRLNHRIRFIRVLAECRGIIGESLLRRREVRRRFFVVVVIIANVYPLPFAFGHLKAIGEHDSEIADVRRRHDIFFFAFQGPFGSDFSRRGDGIILGNGQRHFIRSAFGKEGIAVGIVNALIKTVVGISAENGEEISEID